MTPEEILKDCHDFFDAHGIMGPERQRWLLKRVVTLTTALKIIDMYLGHQRQGIVGEVVLRALYEQDSATLPLGSSQTLGHDKA